MLHRKKKPKPIKDNPSIRDRSKAFVFTMNGPFEINIENYGSLGEYSDRRIILRAWKCTITIEGEGLLIDYFTDIDMKITGRIHAIYF